MGDLIHLPTPNPQDNNIWGQPPEEYDYTPFHIGEFQWTPPKDKPLIDRVTETICGPVGEWLGWLFIVGAWGYGVWQVVRGLM